MDVPTDVFRRPPRAVRSVGLGSRELTLMRSVSLLVVVDASIPSTAVWLAVSRATRTLDTASVAVPPHDGGGGGGGGVDVEAGSPPRLAVTDT